MYCWSLAWRILSITLLVCEMSSIVRWFEHSLALPFFGIGMKTDLFQSCGLFWVFQICWHIEWITFRASSFRIWNSSTGILWPPLALFIEMLSKAHLTSHSRMSGSRWVITPSWLSWSWRSFLYSSSLERSYPTSKEQWLRGCRRAERSYSMFKVRRGGHEEIPFLQGKEQQLRFAGAALKRYPTSKIRETQVRW